MGGGHHVHIGGVMGLAPAPSPVHHDAKVLDSQTKKSHALKYL